MGLSASACPACGSTQPRELERVAVADVLAGYAAPSLGIDLRPCLAAAALREPQLAHWPLLECAGCGLRWYAQAPAGDAALYEALLRHDWYYLGDKPEYVFAAGHVQPGDRVLEVCCGRGAFAARLAPGVAYRGLEFNQKALRQAQEAGLDVALRSVQEEAAEHPGACDVVCHFQVVEHVEDPAGFLAACALALRPGGCLIVAVPAEDSFLALVESGWLNMPPHHLTRWPDRALTQAFERVGVQPSSPWHEPVAAVHRAWHAQVLARAGWLSLWGAEPQRVPRRAPSRGLRLALRLAMRWPLLARRLKARAIRRWPHAGRGHSVCLVGVKAGQGAQGAGA